jgi:hypothetical protein
VYWIHLAQKHVNETSDSIKDEEYLVQLNDCQFSRGTLFHTAGCLTGWLVGWLVGRSIGRFAR